ncbi:MAG TPA: cytochrome P450 [Thiobacillaceae bacterium]|mgnify:CR=1 FL=1|nr:cytochrome P450 [Thiobacillaceae bacterium]
MNETRHADWNPLDPSVLEDQRRAYDEMRERCPVAHSEFMGWSLFRHEDVAAVLSDPQTYSNASRFLAIPNGMDPPVHDRYRAALDPLFEDARMKRLEPRVRGIAADLVEPMRSSGEAEFISAFSMPFVFRTLCAVLGWPEQQWESLGGWAHDNQVAAVTRTPGVGKALASLFSEHVKTNLDAHRGAPPDEDDATDRLLNTEVDGTRLDDDQIVAVLRNWAAGHGTVVAGLGILVMHLARQSELQARLRRDPVLIPAAIEEILRSDGPLVANPRTTTREVEIQGRTIPKGERLTLMWIAANRDPRAFEDPDAIRIERALETGMVWGRGIHVCQGVSLARLELRVALEELLARTERFELTETAPQRAIYPSNGLASLPLRFL